MFNSRTVSRNLLLAGVSSLALAPAYAGTIALPESGTTSAAGTAFSVTTTNGTGTPIAIEGTATGANLNFSYATSLAR